MRKLCIKCEANAQKDASQRMSGHFKLFAIINCTEVYFLV